MSIPSTRFEGELMGETRDNLMQKAERQRVKQSIKLKMSLVK
jgi:hypothetical protein